MEHFEIVLAALFVSVAGLNVIARWLSVPYPIPLVLGGLVLGLLPGMPEIELDPDLVLVIFLPPLLYAAAFFSDLHALRSDLRAISIASIGLVLLTIGAVAVVGHEAIGLSWPLAFALGAIVSPTDPVAATAIMRQLGAPRRLVNFDRGREPGQRCDRARRLPGGRGRRGRRQLLGARRRARVRRSGRRRDRDRAAGRLPGRRDPAPARRRADRDHDLAAHRLRGLHPRRRARPLGRAGGRHRRHLPGLAGPRAAVTPQTRLQGFAVWEILVFLLNATLFILIGLQLPVIADGLDAYTTGELVGYAALVCATVIGTRFVFTFTMPYLIRALDRRPEQRERRVGARLRIVIAWAGMRGAVSLAAALALPLETDAGAPLPERDLILFITFALILVTVVGQGLTLPYLIRRLGVREDGAEEEAEEMRARWTASRAALERLDELAIEEWTLDDTIDRLRGLYEFRQRRVKVRAGKIEDEDGIENRSLAYQRLMHELYTVQRRAVVELRNGGEISNDVMHRLERELDLEESRLEV